MREEGYAKGICEVTNNSSWITVSYRAKQNVICKSLFHLKKHELVHEPEYNQHTHTCPHLLPRAWLFAAKTQSLWENTIQDKTP